MARNFEESILLIDFQLFTDGWFAAASLETARRHNNKVFFYLYDHQNRISIGYFLGNDTQLTGK